MRLRLLPLFCIGLLMLLALPVAKTRADDAPPANVQAILDKLNKGEPVTPAEMQTVQEWTFRKSNGTDQNPANAPTEDENPAMPADVQAILAKMQQGVMPSDAEKARLQSWGAATKGKKNGIKHDATNTENLLKAVLPNAGGSFAQNVDGAPIPGKLTLHLDQSFSGGSAKQTLTGDVTIPVFYTIADSGTGGQFHLKMTENPQGTYSQQYIASGEAQDSGSPPKCPPSTATWGSNVSSSGKMGDRKLFFTGEVVTPPGQRAYTNASISVMATGPYSAHSACGSGTSNVPPPALQGISMDAMRGDVPFNGGFGNMPTNVGGASVFQKLPPEMKASIQSAKFSFDTAAFRAARIKGGKARFSAVYSYQLNLKDAKGTSKTTFIFDIDFPADDKIQVSPDPPIRAQPVTLTANVPGATMFHWRVTGGMCPTVPAEVPPPVNSKNHDGNSWTFTPLCDFNVELGTADDQGVASSATKSVTVKGRTDRWDFDFEGIGSDPVPGPGTMVRDPPALAVGMNRCVHQDDHMIDADNNACGWIHSDHTNPGGRDYSESFTTDVVSDDGPFNGFGYVKTQQLTTTRMKVINDKFEATSDNYKCNVAAGNTTNYERLHQEVMAHEEKHSELAYAAVKKQDPSRILEQFVASPGTDMKIETNKVIKVLDGSINDASSEPNVGAALKGQWTAHALICFPDSNDLIDCGALWAIGTPSFGGCKTAVEGGCKPTPTPTPRRRH